MDGVAAVQSVEVLAIVEVPQHGLGVLASTGAERTIRRQGHGVDVSSVTNVVGLQLAVGQVPNLNNIINIFIINNIIFVHTLTYLSQPQETMMGLALLGENLTQETQSW